MIPMVKVDGVPDSRLAKPGMAFFSGTGPDGKSCEDCAFRGYSRKSSRETWNENTQAFSSRSYRTSACLKYKELTGNHGPVVEKHWDACKFFAQRPKD
jgi:hypothetical protein